MSSDNFFHYPDPRQSELLKQCKVFFDDVQKSGEKSSLTVSQKDFIKEVINEKISLSSDKDHHLSVEIISDAEFSILIDGIDKYHIVKHTKDEGASTEATGKKSPVILIQERIKTKSFLNSIKDFFQAVANLFYRPTYPSKALKERTHKEAVRQDFRALRKSLENGKRWLGSTGHVQMSSKEEDKRKLLAKEVDGLIDNAKKIEKALGSINQQQAVNKAADDFARRIFGLGDTGENSIIIPTGYRNQDGSMQPVMLHFTKDKDIFVLEIYADTYEGKGKVAPLHRREFDQDNTQREDFKAVLDEAFKPLLSTSTKSGALKKGAKPSETFGEIAKKQIEPKLKSAISSVAGEGQITEKTSEPPQKEERAASLTFERFILSVDERMEGKWQVSGDEGQKLKKQPGSPSERVVGWFNHILGRQEAKLTKNEKLNLLYFMTEDYAKDQLRQLKSKPPLFKKPSPETQLVILKNVAGQIAHMRERLAVSLNGDNPLDTRGIPQTLKDTEVQCLEKISLLEGKIRRSKRAGASKLLSQAQKTNLNGMRIGSVELEPPVEPTVEVAAALQLESLDETKWREDWSDSVSEISNLLSDKEAALQQGRQIVKNFKDVQQRNIQRQEKRHKVLENMISEAGGYHELTDEGREKLARNILKLPFLITEEDKKALEKALVEPEITESLISENIQGIVTRFAETASTELEKIVINQEALREIDVQELVSDGELNEEVLDYMISTFVDSMDKEALHELKQSRTADVNSEQLKLIFKQLIICPQVVPETPLNDRLETSSPNLYLPVIHQILDPQLASGSPYSPIAEDFRALMNLRHFIPREGLDEIITDLWKKQIETRIKNGEALIDQSLEKHRITWDDSIKRYQSNIESLESKLDDPQEDRENIENQIAKEEGRIELYEIKLDVIRKVSENPTLLEKLQSFDQLLKEMQERLVDESIEQKAYEELEELKHGEGFYTFIQEELALREQLESLANEVPEMLLPSSLEASKEAVDLNKAASASSTAESNDYSKKLTEHISKLRKGLNDLSHAAAHEPDLFKKQAMYEEIKTRSLELLSIMPPPGTETGQGTFFPWETLTKDQRAEVRRSVQELEHHIWEAQMRLSLTELSGVEKFQMIKGQAISMALIRADIKEEQANIESLLTELFNKNDERLHEFSSMKGVSVLENEGRVKINLEELNPKLSSSFVKRLTKLINETGDHPEINPLILALDMRTLDTQELNCILTQDLTTCLSLDPKLGREVQAVYHFILADQNRGKTDTLQPETSPFKPKSSRRSPLLVSEWKHRSDMHPLNPLMPDLTLDSIATGSGLKPPQQLLLHVLFSQKELDTAAKNTATTELKKILKTGDVESHTYSNGAISWNSDSEQLIIDWENPRLEKDTLIELASIDKTIKKAVDLYMAVSQTAKNELYLKSALDPDFSLYDENDRKPNGRSFFQRHPGIMLGKESPVDIYIDPIQQGQFSVRDKIGREIAEVQLCGKHGFSDLRTYKRPFIYTEESDLNLVMKPKKPFLPTTNQNVPEEWELLGGELKLKDIRELKTYDAWHEYVVSLAGEQVLSIPTQVLENLFRIRQAPADRRQGDSITSYSSDTALRALEFLCDRENKPYIQNDFVQNYLLESMFGPMVLQQALLDHPEAFIGLIKNLKTAIEQARTSREHETLGFYNLVFKRLGAHVDEARNQLHNQGILASSLRGLPVFRGKGGLGAIYRQVQTVTVGYRDKNSAFAMEPEGLNKKAILQPLTAKLEFLELCKLEIESAKDSLKNDLESDEAKSVRGILLSGEIGKRPIDKITDSSARRQAYTHLLQEYRSTGFENLEEEDLLELLKGYELLRHPAEIREPNTEQLKASSYKIQTSSGLSTLEKEVVSWIRQDVLPAIESMDPDKRNTLLKQIINIKLEADGQQPLGEDKSKQFKPVEGKLNLYKLETGVANITLNLSTMEMGGIELTKKTRGPAAIPDEILKREDVQQALGTTVITGKISKSERGGISTYTWSHQGQPFSLRTNGIAVEIKRTIVSSTTLPPGDYTFYPVQLTNKDTHAAQLLDSNGIWKKSGQDNTGYVFTTGMNAPVSEAIYLADIKDDRTIAHLSTLKGARVGAASRLDGPSPVLFADTKNTLILVDEDTGRPNELRLPALNISMIKEKGKWQLTQNGSSLGILKVPDKDEEAVLRSSFGENWDQYIVPVERVADKVSMQKGQKVTSKSTETVYLMLPYRQQVDRKGNVSADQSTIDKMPDMHELRVSVDGKVQGTMAANVYLAHRFLLQAAKTDNPAQSRGLLMKAQEYLEKVQGQPAPKKPQEVESLRYVLEEIAANPAVSVRPPPTLESLSMALKLELFCQHIRTQGRRQGVRTFQTGSEQELNELTKIAQMYQAHTVLSGTVSRERKLHKEMFSLTEREIAALSAINRRMLQQLSSQDVGTKAELYFGATGRLATTVKIERAKTVNPQFLLALLRMAKPRNRSITLKGQNSPLPAGNLLENFWSYLISIKEEGLTPKDLLFLYDESILPPTNSPEQEQQLRELDLQARQFLLSMADLMDKAGGIKDPLGDAKKNLEESKTSLFESDDKKNTQILLSLFKGKPGIGQNFQKTMEGIDSLEVHAVPDTDPPMPDLGRLIHELNNQVKTPLENFKDDMETALDSAEKLIEETKSANEELRQELESAKKSLRLAETAKEEAIEQFEDEFKEQAKEESYIKNLQVLQEEHDEKIVKLTARVEEAEKKHQAYVEETISDPLTGDLIPREAIISGEYADVINLNELKSVTSKVQRASIELDQTINSMRESSDLLNQWNELQKYMKDIETVQFDRNKWFELPESGAARALIEHQILETGRAPSLFRAGASMIKQLGPITTARLVKAASEIKPLQDRLEEIDLELKSDIPADRKERLQTERGKIKKKLLSNPLGNLEAAGLALAPLVVAGAAQGFKPIEYKPEKMARAGESDVSQQILDDPQFNESFTSEERDQIAVNLANMDRTEKKSYVQQLQAALNMQATLLEARTGLQSNLESINVMSEKVLRGKPNAKPLPSPHDFEDVAGLDHSDKYLSHFSSKAGFSDKAKLAALFNKIDKFTSSDEDVLAFLKNKAENLATPESQDEQLRAVEDSISEIRREIKPQPVPAEFEPYIDALALVGKAATTDYKNETTTPILESFATKMGSVSTGEELLLFIQDAYDKLAPHVAEVEHKAMVNEIIAQTLPEDSHYKDEFLKGLEKIKRDNPLAYSVVVGEDQLEQVEDALIADVAQLQEQVKQQQAEIIRRLEAVPLGNLPRAVQKIRMRRGSGHELLEAACKEYRKGSFEADLFKSGSIPKGEFSDLSLDKLIGKYLFDDTRRQVLQGGSYNAFDSVQNLYRLKQEKRKDMDLKAEAPVRKREIQDKIEKKRVELGGIDDWIPEDLQLSDAEIMIAKAVLADETKGDEEKQIKTELPKDGLVPGKIYFNGSDYILETDQKTICLKKQDLNEDVEKIQTARLERQTALEAEIDNLQRLHDHYEEEIDIRLSGLDSQWKKESDKIRDFTGRCQNQPHLKSNLGSLAPYTRHINYLQQRMGIVLRDEQIQTLKEIIDNPALLKQLRMGLGKTSVILPFALMILSAKGHNAIGMVPKALFDTNFDEMDETTRTVFEMAGSRFQFARQDASLPLNKLSLHVLSSKCEEFFSALDRGEYILTTIESKASLDNKIIEVERSQALIQSRVDAISENEEIEEDDKEKQIAPLYALQCDHQMALDMLYRVKAVFEADKTRLIIDEVDSVAKSNKTVNSEIGNKTPVSQSIQQVATDIFDVIRSDPELEGLFAQIQSNNQFTLDEAQVNEFIKKIGKALIKDVDLQGHDESEVLDWLAGESTCPFDPLELRNLGADAQKLKIQRKALNSALRSSLGLKAGLSADFDPTHGAIGIPASQGVTSKTTKYSDPIMQVVLTQMIALYKPQGEPYLQATAREVISEMKADLKTIDKLIEVKPEEPALLSKQAELKAGIKKLSKITIPEILKNELKQELEDVNQNLIENEDDLQLNAKKSDLELELRELEDYMAHLSPDNSPAIQEAIEGHESLNVFLRLRFAQQVAKRGMIYVSSNELARPNQHALRGCNVIGLTGTATENTSHVITGTGHDDAMKGITETGRESTAEVVYRFVKALKTKSQSPREVLQTPVKTYSLKTDEAFSQFVNIGRKGSGYRFLINQAGACDEMSLREIAQELHRQCERPIIYLDMDEEGRTEKVALINGIRRPLNDLNPDEKRQVEEEGFTYYHTPHVRGTHFNLPGSKGAIMLSPTVNANDRDQAFYRARGLGEEHVVEPFISEKLSKEFQEKTGKTMSLGDLLKIQHEQTRTEESKEDLSAYVLHLKGQVVLAADKAKKRIQLQDESIKSFNQWSKTEDLKANQQKIAARVVVDQLLEKLSVRETGNDAYMSSLDSEMRQGGLMPTDEYLKSVVIAQEIKRAARFLEEIDKIETGENEELAPALKTVREELEEAVKRLKEEQKKIESEWEGSLSKKLPAETSSAPATQETAETEAEAEAEAEAVAETTAESESEKARKKRAMKTRDILTVPDYNLLNSLEEMPRKYIESRHQYTAWFGLPESENSLIKKGWKDDVGLTASLRHSLELAGQGKGVAVKALIVEYGEKKQTLLATASEADQMVGHMSHLYVEKTPNSRILRLAYGFTVKPIFNEEGEMELQYGDTILAGESKRDNFDDLREFKGELYLSFIHLGFSPISNEGWKDIEEYWKGLDVPSQEQVKESLENALKSSNPILLELASKHMWEKPPEVAISLGGVSKPPVEKVTDINEAKVKIAEAAKDPYERSPYAAAKKWINTNADDSIKQDLLDWIEKEY